LIFEAFFIVTRSYPGDTHIARLRAHIQWVKTFQEGGAGLKY